MQAYLQFACHCYWGLNTVGQLVNRDEQLCTPCCHLVGWAKGWTKLLPYTKQWVLVPGSLTKSIVLMCCICAAVP